MERWGNEGLSKQRMSLKVLRRLREIMGNGRNERWMFWMRATHFMLNKNIDFYYRPFANRTVVFVFIHAGGFDETLNQILSSFRWSNGS